MKYLLSLTLAAALVACGSCVPRSIGERPDTLSQPAVAKLMMVDDEGTTTFMCTVFKVGDGLVATAGHCCNDGVRYTLAGPNAVRGTDVKVLVDFYSDEEEEEGEASKYVEDVCIMSGHIAGPPVQLAWSDPPVGGHIWTLGFPHEQFLISEGIWSGRGTGDDGLGISSMVGNPGASGSPVLDSRGQCVGVFVRYWVNMDNLTFVAPLEKLRRAIELARKE